MTARRAFTALLWLLTTANVAIVAIRLVSLFATSSLVQIPNGEAIDLYAIWKLRHGYPLYELVTRPPFSLTPYNYLFFYAYAGAMDLFHVADEATSFWARIPTLAFAFLGAWIQYATTTAIARRSYGHAPRGLVAMLAVATWIGVGVMGWSALSVRPDVGAAAFGLAGLSLCWMAESKERRSLFVAAGVSFACAWLFKQSFVMMFGGAVAYLVIRRRSCDNALRLVAPFAIVLVVSLAFGSPEYRFDAFRAQTFTSISVHDAQFWLRSGLLPNLVFWTVPVWWLIDGRRVASDAPGLDLVICAAFVTGGWALLTIGREGASTHYLIEPSIPAAVWTSIVLCAEDSGRAPGRGFGVAAWSTLPMVVFALAVLFHVHSLQTIVGLRARGDRLTLALAGEFDRRAALRDRIRERPPSFIADEALSLPWFSTGNRYPAIQIEHVVFDALARHGLVEGGGVSGLVRSRYFGCIVVDPGSALAGEARAAGYASGGAAPGPIGNTLEIYSR